MIEHLKNHSFKDYENVVSGVSQNLAQTIDKWVFHVSV